MKGQHARKISKSSSPQRQGNSGVNRTATTSNSVESDRRTRSSKNKVPQSRDVVNVSTLQNKGPIGAQTALSGIQQFFVVTI